MKNYFKLIAGLVMGLVLPACAVPNPPPPTYHAVTADTNTVLQGADTNLFARNSALLAKAMVAVGVATNGAAVTNGQVNVNLANNTGTNGQSVTLAGGSQTGGAPAGGVTISGGSGSSGSPAGSVTIQGGAGIVGAVVVIKNGNNTNATFDYDNTQDIFNVPIIAPAFAGDGSGLRNIPAANQATNLVNVYGQPVIDLYGNIFNVDGDRIVDFASGALNVPGAGLRNAANQVVLDVNGVAQSGLTGINSNNISGPLNPGNFYPSIVTVLPQAQSWSNNGVVITINSFGQTIGTNFVTHAHWMTGTNGHYSEVNQYSNVFAIGTNSFAYTPSNGPAFSYSNGRATIGGNPVLTNALGSITTGLTIPPINPASYVAWGDSLTLGGQGFSGIGYPNVFQLLSTIPVINEGQSGWTSSQIVTLFNSNTNLWPNPTFIQSGRNDPQSQYTNTTLTNIAYMVSCLASFGNSNYVIMPIVNATNECPLGDSPATYRALTNFNNTLSMIYTNHYFDFRTRLVAYNLPSESWYTTNDTVGPSLRAAGDSLHFNGRGYTLQGMMLFNSSMMNLGTAPATVGNIYQVFGQSPALGVYSSNSGTFTSLNASSLALNNGLSLAGSTYAVPSGGQFTIDATNGTRGLLVKTKSSVATAIYPLQVQTNGEVLLGYTTPTTTGYRFSVYCSAGVGMNLDSGANLGINGQLNAGQIKTSGGSAGACAFVMGNTQRGLYDEYNFSRISFIYDGTNVMHMGINSADVPGSFSCKSISCTSNTASITSYLPGIALGTGWTNQTGSRITLSKLFYMNCSAVSGYPVLLYSNFTRGTYRSYTNMTALGLTTPLEVTRPIGPNEVIGFYDISSGSASVSTNADSFTLSN